jgi:hypothetical protein
MAKRIPMSAGEQFGLFTVLSDQPVRVGKQLSCLCRCRCGNELLVNAHNLRAGKTLGCGCERNKQTGERSRSHGMSKAPIYAVWLQARARCHDSRHKQYPAYGGRGIAMCEQWRNSFPQFLADMGEPPFPRAMLERVDNDQGYSPANCKWATRTEQNRNRRNNRLFEFRGRSMFLVDWAAELGINLRTLVSRIYQHGWSIEKSFTSPVQQQRMTHSPIKTVASTPTPGGVDGVASNGLPAGGVAQHP